MLSDIVGSLQAQGFKRVLVVNGHGGNSAGRPAVDDRVLWHDWWAAPRTRAAIDAIDPAASHASWMENFPWTRLPGVTLPDAHKPLTDIAPLRSEPAATVREAIGDGVLGGFYARPDEEVLRVWAIGVAETRDALEHGWSGNR